VVISQIKFIVLIAKKAIINHILMASSSSSYQRLKHSKQNSTSTVQVTHNDQSLNDRQARKSQTGSSTPGIKNGNIPRRRSAPGARNSTTSKSQTTAIASQRSRSNLARHMIGNNDEDENDDESMQIDTLNISSTSAATDNMDTSQQYDVDQSSASDNNNIQNENPKIKKHELISKYFIKLNTGGYYCKKCDGTKKAKKVSLYVLTLDRDIHVAISYK
jgi:hypothetical protein